MKEKISKDFKIGFNAGISVIRDWFEMEVEEIKLSKFVEPDDTETVDGWYETKELLEPWKDDEIEDNWIVKGIINK